MNRPHLVPLPSAEPEHRRTYRDVTIGDKTFRVVPGAGAHGFRWYAIRPRPDLGVDELIEVGGPDYAALVEALTGLERRW